MPFARPTLAELVVRSEGELASRLGLGALLPRSVLSALARLLASLTHGLYGYLDWISRQVVPSTKEAEVLEAWADEFGLERRAAARAAGDVDVAGLDGTVVPSGTILARADGQRYQTTAPGTIASGIATVPVLAETAGLEGNAAAATALSLSSIVAGTTGAVVGTAGLTGGLGEETDAELRERLRRFLSARPQGGSAADYDFWAREVSGVTRVFVLENWDGPGTVMVLFAVDDDPAGPIPSPSKVAEVLARIDDPTRRDSRPLGVAVTVQAPIAQAVPVTLELVPNTPAVQEQVRASLADMLLREGRPGGTIRRAKFDEAISTAAGETDHVLALPAGDLVVGATSLPALGTLTFT